jgi:hypothetical protein
MSLNMIIKMYDGIKKIKKFKQEITKIAHSLFILNFSIIFLKNIF